ncbi:MAG: response regulator transcription factor [Bdellovibrionales bacterium]|nr:response regulator transcription factor [Bdellovibrionales bacterium]
MQAAESLKVAVIEDEPEILDLTVNYLRSSGMQVEGYLRADEALPSMVQNPPDVIVVDNLMPGLSGDEFVRRLRSEPNVENVPIIMVTAQRTEDAIVKSFDCGVDDYVTKPFYLKELLCRVKAATRRAQINETQPLLELDMVAHRVMMQGEEVILTLTEFKLLHQLYTNLDTVQSRENLRHVALSHDHVTDRTIDVHIASLRQKLGIVGKNIRTIRGVGYKMTSF